MTTINMAASMLQVNSLSSLQTTPFPSLLEAVECVEAIHLSGGPEILPNVLKRTFPYVEGINEHITKLSEITSIGGTPVLASPLELVKEKRKNDLDVAQEDLNALRDMRQQLTEQMGRLIAERTAIATEVSQISASPGVVGPANRTPAQRQTQLQHDLDSANVPTRKDANNAAIAACQTALDTASATVIQYTGNVRNLKLALYSPDITDQEIAVATATRQKMLSMTVGSSSALNFALNSVITAIVKHYLLVQVPGLNVISQGISQLEVLASDSPVGTDFISIILRRQKAVKALRFLGSCFGGPTSSETEGAVRRIQDGSPTVLLQRVGVTAYSVVSAVLATPTDTYLERILTAARAYQKVCTTHPGVVSTQAPPTPQGGSSPSSTKNPRHEELLLPGQSPSQSPLRPASRGFPNPRPPSPVAFHIRDNPEPDGTPFDVFTDGMELALPLRQRKNLAGNSTPSRESITESSAKEHTREWYKDDCDGEDAPEEEEESEQPLAKKTKPNSAKKLKPAGPVGKGKSAETPPALFSPGDDSFNNAATAFLASLTSKLLGSPGAPMPAIPQHVQHQPPLPGLVFPPGYGMPPLNFSGQPMQAFFAGGPPNVFGGHQPSQPPPVAPPAGTPPSPQQNPGRERPYIKRHALSDTAYATLKDMRTVCINSYQSIGPCGIMNCNRTHAVSNSDPNAQQCATYNDMNSVCRTCFQPGGCPYRHVILNWKERGLPPPPRRFSRV
jgi:hypothetical protein